MPHLGLRISDSLSRRLDDLVRARGMRDRSEVVRSLILEAAMEDGERETVPDRDELLRLLGDSARGGSVTAMKALLEEHRRDGNEDAQPEVDAIDELAQRRAERAG